MKNKIKTIFDRQSLTFDRAHDLTQGKYSIHFCSKNNERKSGFY
jgi:hypothetical protein